jgi:hypothetical protein
MPTLATSIVFTFRLNGAATAAICTVATGQTSGSSAIALSLTAGNLIDVQVVTGNSAGQVTWAVGP